MGYGDIFSKVIYCYYNEINEMAKVRLQHCLVALRGLNTTQNLHVNDNSIAKYNITIIDIRTWAE